jgi:hypothetical protein
VNRAIGRGEVVRPLGVIDTLTAGYETINRRLWLLLIPIALDLLFWFGPKLSVVRLAGYLPLGSLGFGDVLGVTELLARANLLFLVALYIPTVLGKVPFDVVAPTRGLPERTIIQFEPATFALAVVVLLPVCLLVAAFYLGHIGQLVRPASAPAGWLRLSVRTWRRLVVVHLAALVGLVALAIPAGLVVAAGGAWVSRDFGSFLLFVFQVTLLWLGFYFFFWITATVVADGNPVRAALTSVELVRSNFWPAVSLIGLILVIQTGLPIVWRSLATPVASLGAWGSWGLIAGIVANAYVGSGLAAASMLFYRDRVLLAQNKD